MEECLSELNKLMNSVTISAELADPSLKEVEKMNSQQQNMLATFGKQSVVVFVEL